MKNKFPIIPFALLSLLLIPLVAMQITNEMVWSMADFLLMGCLLFSLGIGIEFILRKNKTFKKKFFFASILIAIFMLVWAELAIGIFGTPFAGN